LTSTVEVEAPKAASIVEHQVRSFQLKWLWSLPLAAR
jgi:hypothetical protein